MADTILTQKIRDPREGQEGKWYSPFFITDDEKVHINGKLNDKDAVNTKNIVTGAVTGDKIYSSENNDNNRPIRKDHIKNGEVTFEKLDSNTIIKSRIGYSIDEETGDLIPNKLTDLDLDKSSVGFFQMKKIEDDKYDSQRPITSSSIQNGAITKNKIYATANDENDDDRPVIANNIKNGSIIYGKLYGSNKEKETEETEKPVRGENIQNASIPLNKLSEPFYQMQMISKNEKGLENYKLHLYPDSHLISFKEDPHWEGVYDWRKQN